MTQIVAGGVGWWRRLISRFHDNGHWGPGSVEHGSTDTRQVDSSFMDPLAKEVMNSA